MVLSTSQAVHMVGNAHIDPVWQWRWTEGCAEAIGTCWAAIDRLEEDPDFVFTRGEALIYEWIERFEPALFERIQHFVRAGRWVIVNGWWLQPDCNLPDGEAFLRQGLYGKAYFRQKFGIDVRVGYNVDSFGHAGTLPALLRHTGFEQYVFMRPGKHEKVLPAALFDWISPDGSCVSAFRLTDEYQTSRGGLDEKIERAEAYVQNVGQPIMSFYGVGNHGGGPTRENLKTIKQIQSEGRAVLFSDPVHFFADVASLPRPQVQDELQMHAIGCYSAISTVKSLNRRAEARLALAEAASALALHTVQASYPHEAFRQLWKKLLFHQFHDILGGACTASAMRDAFEALGGIIQGADEMLNAAVRQLAATVAPGPDPKAASFLVFNLTGSELHVPLEYEPWLERQTHPLRLLNAAGAEVPYQELPAEGFVPGLGIHRLLFTPSCAPFSYQLYTVEAAEAQVPSTTLRTTSVSIENAVWRLEIDTTTGGIAHMFEKESGHDVFAGTAHASLLVDDDSDTWSHKLEGFGFTGSSARFERSEVIDQGPLRGSIRVWSRIGVSSLISTYSLYDDPALPLEIHVRLDWHEKNKLLRLCYPLAFSAPTFRYEVPAGSLVRPAHGREYPAQRWVLVSDDNGRGCVLANDAKYSYAAHDNVLAITAVRSPVYAHHDPYVLQAENDYLYTDQGEQEFTLRLQVGNDITPLTAYRLANGLLRAPVVTPHVSRGGHAPHSATLLQVAAHSSLVTWLKGAEDEHGLVLRALEVDGKKDTMTLGSEQDTHEMRPYGLLTLRNHGTDRWRETNGLEELSE